MSKIEYLNIKINDIEYKLRCQFRNITELMIPLHQYRKEGYDICILNRNDMYCLYCSTLRHNILFKETKEDEI